MNDLTLTARPEWNTAPIRCGRSKCKWRGYEEDLILERREKWMQRVCPECGCDEYMFMTPGEIKAWERKKAKGAQT
jgi:SUMO ligase MMS21 Smc5/6 complex component